MDDFELFFKCDDEIYNRHMVFQKNTVIKDAFLQFLRATNSIITLDPDNIIFFLKAKILNTPELLNKRLFEIFKENKVFIKVVDAGFNAGGGSPINFCDVSNSIPEGHKLTQDAPSYRTVGKGINIYGICKGTNCKAHNKEVIVPIKKRIFDLIEEKYELKCPECCNIIIPKTCGFYKCEYKVSGKKCENYNIERFDFTERASNPDEILYYNPSENGYAKMIELKFEVLKYL